ncbi:FAD-binding oxidoreductase [Achromobacter seleniivolatilans]|uniref:FAD-binding oxidoreductase n=1 Tax=Achromobacter seleniivolatilans TaxID=3047478 RepID=A0ABY9M7N0_9BURK|nr:FAD-binding oxidoreductase [Achromobacter sp. R39]WMD22198.1 FAD-binding oxidoreductase [Achromobacter sp. R39]
MSVVKKVVVIGAGVLGLSVATEAAARGAQVVVVELPPDHRTASLRSYSWLNAFGAAPESYRRLRLLSLDRYRALAAAVPQAGWLRFHGSLTWRNAAQQEQLKSRAAQLGESGYSARWLDTDQAIHAEPALDRAAIDGFGLVESSIEGWIDLPEYLSVLRQGLSARQVQFVTVGQSPRLQAAGGKITGLVIDDGGTIHADAVVLAVGAGTPEVLRQVGFELPAQTNNALLVTARRRGVAPKSVLRAPDVAIRPRGDGALALHADWADLEVTGDDTQGWSVPPGVIQAVTTAAARWLDGSPEWSDVRTGIGRRPIPGDQRAVAGELPSVSGLHVLFSHSAATLAPILSELLAGEIVDGAQSPLLADFRPARFVTPAAA